MEIRPVALTDVDRSAAQLLALRVRRAVAEGTLHGGWLTSEIENATRPKVCKCGRQATAGTRQVSYPGYAPVWWHCDEHASVPPTAPWAGGKPMVRGSDGVWVDP